MKVIIFGASGTAGSGVLRACLADPSVEEARAITRSPLSAASDKLRTFLHKDYLDYSSISEAFADVDACFYCLGVSATQVSGEQEYRKITYDFALAAARMLKLQSPDAVFHFISGRSTGLNSRFMWARVKAETERDLMSFTNAVCWRPAYIAGELSHNRPLQIRIVRTIFKLMKPSRSLYVDAEDIGRAMIRATTENIRSRIIENPEIRAMAEG
ncbi:MAG TPA: NmrA family NAD(P)-binding protein [Blastocatellia bacterium]|nr:NmrA family NAD(P)-binding protein [Blastocatellia bacterium]